jgi:hypothetical protein
MVYEHIRNFFTNYVLYYATWLLVIYINITGLSDFWIDNEHSIYNLFQPVFISMFAYIFLYTEKQPLPVLAYFSMLKLFDLIIYVIFHVAIFNKNMQLPYGATKQVGEVDIFKCLACFVLVLFVAIFFLPERLFTLWGAQIRTIQDKLTFLLQVVTGMLSTVIHMELVKYFSLTNAYLSGAVGITCFVAATKVSDWLVNKLFTPRELGVFIYNQIKEDLPNLKELELSTNIKVVDSPNDVCAICLDDFYDRSNITCQLKCKHLYHVECLKKQRRVSVNPIRDKCPMCRISYGTVVQQVYVEEPKNDLVVVGQKAEHDYNAVWQWMNSGKQNAQEKQEQGQGGEEGGGDEMSEADLQLYHKVIATHKPFSFGTFGFIPLPPLPSL